MTSPRSYDGVGYYAPSFSSGTPIYDSLVAERGVPQIAPINVPAALPPAPYQPAPGFGSALESTSLLPALPPARLALGPGTGTGSTYPAPSYATPQPPVPGYGGQPYLPGPRVPAQQPQQGYASPQPWDTQGGFRPSPPAPVAPVRPVPPPQFFQQPGQPSQQQPPQQQYAQGQFGQSQFGQGQFGQGQFNQQGQQGYQQQQQYGQQAQPHQGQAY
ncbi:hypothetical protein P3T37_005890 [Kitasatospora sp. MAA4]|uniref:DUF6643 family protein n=1 Tax=Kitasatospora sp. MAA4 TaxID=3035093 RepID=UPI0024734470|nr:DUF6643 family protein [Kitasatospora sp. MAA4]MDH6136462.1 hypothetical protein [Kitasatospora sp. MAA4]